MRDSLSSLKAPRQIAFGLSIFFTLLIEVTKLNVSTPNTSQVSRLISYNVISQVENIESLPKLENMGSGPRNEYELKAQGYFVGNCAHCHNPKGLAFTKENQVTLNLTAGSIFKFDQFRTSSQIRRHFVDKYGRLEESHLWRKVSDSTAQLGGTSQMPMHTAGGPDCKVLRVVGRWIKSFESLQAAEDFNPVCKTENPFEWIDQDFTTVKTDKYVPRRADWQDASAGMPAKFRQLSMSSALEALLKKEFAVGYWSKLNKENLCQFPEKQLPAEEIRPWMLNKDGKPKEPFGEIYSTTPGSYFYRNSCSKCHGEKVDGNGSLAKGILNWSGGNIVVANLIDGMFGKKGENLKLFDLDGKNLGANYLIWMAMSGTRVQFPPQVAEFVGKHGGQMLYLMRDKCLRQISIEKGSSQIRREHEMFNKVCFAGNLEPGHPLLSFDPNTLQPVNSKAVDEWLDQATYNVGFAIFDYIKETSQGVIRPNVDQCEFTFPKK